MARPNRFQIMDLYKNEIKAALYEINELLLTIKQIEFILMTNKKNWKLPSSTTINEFLNYLVEQKKILFEIEFGPSSRKVKRYLFKDSVKADPKLIALSLYSKSYLSHYSAVSYHDLTDEIIKSIYVNHEQLPKNIENPQINITQEDIDKAFSRPQRQTNNFIDLNSQRIYLLNGGYTGNLGVLTKGNIQVTDPERTLIDISVRPQYCGGVFEVLNVFTKAKGEVSVNRLSSYLKRLNYVYPYHQVIGFYLEISGYKENALKLMEKFPIKNEFYLSHNIPEKAYSKRWKLHYPKNM